MTYTVTVDTFPSFVESFAQKLTSNKKFVVQIYDQDELVEFDVLPADQITEELSQKIARINNTPTHLLHNI